MSTNLISTTGYYSDLIINAYNFLKTLVKQMIFKLNIDVYTEKTE